MTDSCVSYARLVDGRFVRFTRSEFAVFMALWNARGAFLRYDDLRAAIWGRGDVNSVQSVIRGYIRVLRAALSSTRFRIETFHGVGWRMVRLPLGGGPRAVVSLQQDERCNYSEVQT